MVFWSLSLGGALESLTELNKARPAPVLNLKLEAMAIISSSRNIEEAGLCFAVGLSACPASTRPLIDFEDINGVRGSGISKTREGGSKIHSNHNPNHACHGQMEEVPTSVYHAEFATP